MAGLAAAAGAAAAAFSFLRAANSPQGGYGGRRRRAALEQQVEWICLHLLVYIIFSPHLFTFTEPFRRNISRNGIIGFS